MKKLYACVITLTIAMGLLVSCKAPVEKEPESQGIVIDEAKVTAFVGTYEYGVYDSDVAAVFVMDKTRHEMIYNTKAARFVIQDDDQYPLLTSVMSPAAEEGHYTVTITSSVEGLMTGTYTMKMVKSENETAWLWEVENRFGLVIMVL